MMEINIMSRLRFRNYRAASDRQEEGMEYDLLGSFHLGGNPIRGRITAVMLCLQGR